MSEPTKEQRLKKARDVLWKIDLRGSDGAWLSAQAAIADALATETAPLHEQIASLETQLAEEKERAERWHAAAKELMAAPPAQTQQVDAARWSIMGGGHDKRSVEIIANAQPPVVFPASLVIVTPDGDVVAEVFGNPAHIETAQQRAEAHLSEAEKMVAATAPAAYCHGCGRALHADEIHCDDCADDLREDEGSQDGTAALAGQPASEGWRIALDAIDGERRRCLGIVRRFHSRPLDEIEMYIMGDNSAPEQPAPTEDRGTTPEREHLITVSRALRDLQEAVEEFGWTCSDAGEGRAHYNAAGSFSDENCPLCMDVEDLEAAPEEKGK